MAGEWASEELDDRLGAHFFAFVLVSEQKSEDEKEDQEGGTAIKGRGRR